MPLQAAEFNIMIESDTKAQQSWEMQNDFSFSEHFGASFFLQLTFYLHTTVAKVKPVIMYKFLRILANAIAW